MDKHFRLDKAGWLQLAAAGCILLAGIAFTNWEGLAGTTLPSESSTPKASRVEGFRHV
jgi:hypothetical protein